MARLAIKGHNERGKEVIALLEMLGGKNDWAIPYNGCDDTVYYHIEEDGLIISSRFSFKESGGSSYTFTLEQFEKEFPYKVGDEVMLRTLDKVRITNMYWDPCSDQVIYEALSVNDGREYDCLNANQLSPCEQQTSPDKAKAPSLIWQQYSEGRFVCKLPEDLELDKIEDGIILLKPKKKVLPKTYEECCEVLGFSSEGDVVYSGNWVYGGVYLEQHLKALRSFSKLIICRSAYWKLADGWNPSDWDTAYSFDRISNGFVSYNDRFGCSCTFEFPTEEMRDTFYENFYDLINECKGLL